MTGIKNLFYCFYNLANLTGFDNKIDLLLRKKHNLFILLHRIFRRTFLDTAAHNLHNRHSPYAEVAEFLLQFRKFRKTCNDFNFG